MGALDTRFAPLVRTVRPVLILVLGIGLVALLLLGFRIQSAMSELRSEATDNLHWNLSQLEIDLVRLSEELRADVAAPEAPLQELRKRYDLFYSRAQNVISGKGYAPPGLETHSKAMADMLDGFLTRETPLIDSTDAALRQGLPGLQARLLDLRGQLRRTSTLMVEELARLGDERRAAFSLLVRQMGLATITTIAVLLGLLAIVVRLNAAAAREASQTARVSRRLTATVDSALDAIIVSDSDGRIIQYNPSAESIFGYRRDEVMGQDMAKLMIPARLQAAHAERMARMRAGGHDRPMLSERFQFEALDRTGREFPVELQISAAEGDEGTIFIAFLRDISDRLAAEAALTRARDEALSAEQAKTDFLAVMSHEMRTPLNGVIASLEIARRKVTDDDCERFIALAQDSAYQLLRHANDVLDITRLESGGFSLMTEDFDLAEVLSGLVETVRPICIEKGISLDFAMLGDSPALHGDPFRLCQIVQNFLSNAIKAVKTGGITVEVDVSPSAGTAAQTIEVRVIDSGPGIAAQDQDRIFDDFIMLDPSFQRTGQGAGLGLAIARRLAAALGGEIGVESAPGEGSCFWLRCTLPLAEPARPGGAAADRRPAPPALDVLVVEDNATNRDVLEEMLRHLGQRVVLASDGASGAAAAARQPFDLILMDISMPVMDGLAATRLIRAEGASKQARIVAVTAHSMPADLARFRSAGMDDVLHKPISSAALVQVLSGQTARPAPPDAGLIDAERIADLRASIGAAACARLAATFLRDGAAQQAALRRAAQDGMAADEFSALCHQASGVAAVFGALALRSHYAQAETDAAEGQIAAARARIARDTEGLWQATVQALTRHLDVPS